MSKLIHKNDVRCGAWATGSLLTSKVWAEVTCSRCLAKMEDPALSPAVTNAMKRFNAVLELRDALDESVKLQSHYAGLLNMWDGGKRLQFQNANEWMQRLAEVKALAATEKGSASDKG